MEFKEEIQPVVFDGKRDKHSEGSMNICHWTKIVDGFTFHNLLATGCVKFARCVPTVVDHLKVHFQQELAKTHHIHLIYLSNMLIQIAINV